MDYSYFIAKKLSLSERGKSSSPGVKVAIVAVALSVAIMLAAIAIVTGFKEEIRNRVVGFNSHITLYATPTSDRDSDCLVNLTPSLTSILDSIPYIEDYSLELSIPAVIKTDNDFKGIYFRGISSGKILNFIKSNIIAGSMPDFDKDGTKFETVISLEMASKLSLKVGDKIDIYFISDDVRARKLTVAGIYNSHFSAYDNVYIYGSLPMLQGVVSLSPSKGSALHIYIDDFDKTAEYSNDIQEILTEAVVSGDIYKYYKVENVLQTGASYFRWLSLLDTNVLVVLILMTIVACITLISGMLIIILDKIRFIGIMKSLGCPNKSISRIFIYLALKVAGIGMIIGNALMLLLLYVQRHTHFIPLNGDSYYIDYVPVKIEWSDVILFNICVVAVIYLALLLPAVFASKISPSRSIRYE
jgi:lipoprotein-releasing system permease protein